MDGEIPVSTNLAQALKRIRYPFGIRYVWVDAVCIDQSNLTERGHQVKMMGYIYSKASRVLVWLGADTDATPKGPLEVVLEAAEGRISPRESVTKEAFGAMSCCDWFSRLWVVWELLCSKSALFIWG